MPRGFLVKRQKSSNAFSYRARHNSEEDRSDSGSEPENLYATTHAFGSPDSGYCHSPVSLSFKDPGARILATTYPEVKTVNAGSTGGRTIPELMPARKEVSEEEIQPMDYSTHVTTTTTTTNHVDNRSSQGRLSTGPLQDVNDNTGRSHAVSRHPADHQPRSTLEETVSNRYHGVDLTRGFNLNSDLYSQVKYHHQLLQYPGGPAFTNGRFPMPPLAAPGAAQEEMMMDTGRPESTCSSSPRSSPAPSVGTPTHTQQGSPFYFSNFDRLSVSSPGGPGSKNPASSTSNKPASAPGTPGSPGKKRGASTQNGTGESKPKTPKKSKAVRKIKFELEDKSSPVSGTFIRDADDTTDSSGGTVVCGDIDSAFNLVEVTPEARQELERIENKIGDYVCQLCKEFYTDAFQLAQHKCSRIVHIEYRCPECDKLFNCPANLASHRRWHKPRPASNNNNNNKGSSNSNSNSNSNNNNNNNNKNNNSITVDLSSTTKTIHEAPLGGQTMVDGAGLTRKTPSPGADSNEGLFECEQCGKKFRRQAYLRKHVASHADEQPYPCQFCGKVLRSETARAKHVLQHAIGGAPVGAKDFPCGVCAAIFPSRPALERHARLHTSEVYPCKYCSNTFYSSPGLTRHINKCHPSENRQVILLQMPVNRPC